MQFVNSRPNNNYNNNNTLIMPYNVYYKKPIQNNNVQSAVRINSVEKTIQTTSVQIVNQIIKQNPVVSPTIPQQKKMKWGEPTWFLFHTLAEKVKEEYFHTIRYELLNTIVIICKNLPCPDCANHATEYMKKVDFNSIRTKQDLKLMLFQFHNVVNQKKQFPLFSINELDSKYSNANLVNIIQTFMFYFQDKSHSIRMIANDIYRSRIADQLKIWFNNNIQYFNCL
jgi:hypothetical protein